MEGCHSCWRLSGGAVSGGDGVGSAVHTIKFADAANRETRLSISDDLDEQVRVVTRRVGPNGRTARTAGVSDQGNREIWRSPPK